MSESSSVETGFSVSGLTSYLKPIELNFAIGFKITLPSISYPPELFVPFKTLQKIFIDGAAAKSGAPRNGRTQQQFAAGKWQRQPDVHVENDTLDRIQRSSRLYRKATGEARRRGEFVHHCRTGEGVLRHATSRRGRKGGRHPSPEVSLLHDLGFRCRYHSVRLVFFAVPATSRHEHVLGPVVRWQHSLSTHGPSVSSVW